MLLTKQLAIKIGLLLGSLVAGISPAQAVSSTYILEYSGANFGNSAQAHGTIKFDSSLLPNPSSGLTLLPLSDLAVTHLSLTVSQAASGNGTFDLAGYEQMTWDTGGATLDFSQELVGQATLNGAWAEWSSLGTMGEFGLWAAITAQTAPTAGGWYSLVTDNDNGDRLSLTSFRPEAAPVPIPAAVWLFGSALAGIAAFSRKARVKV